MFFFSFLPTFDSPSPYDDEFKKSQLFSENCDINHLHTPEWHLHIMIQVHGYSLRRKAPYRPRIHYQYWLGLSNDLKNG